MMMMMMKINEDVDDDDDIDDNDDNDDNHDDVDNVDNVDDDDSDDGVRRRWIAPCSDLQIHRSFMSNQRAGPARRNEKTPKKRNNRKNTRAAVC